jgi:hypothetical protein
MTEATDSLYRRLAALDSRRPGEWVRRKVQAYSAQQAAERALRENFEGRATPAAATASAPTPKATALAPAARTVPTQKKTAGKSFLLILIGATVAVVALVGFLVVPGLMTPRGFWDNLSISAGGRLDRLRIAYAYAYGSTDTDSGVDIIGTDTAGIGTPPVGTPGLSANSTSASRGGRSALIGLTAIGPS